MIYSGARELEAAEKSKDPARLAQLSFAVAPQASSVLLVNMEF